MIPNPWLKSAGLLGFLGVAAGAFGAHALAERLDVKELEWWHTASQYHLLHALALGLVGLLAAPGKARAVAGAGFAIGILLFSGSLYAMALGAPHWLGAITPIGGTAMLVAWLALACTARRT